MRFVRVCSAALFVCLLSWTVSVLMAIGPVTSPVSLTAPGTAATQNFDTLASTGTSAVVPAGWTFDESGTAAAVNGSYTAGTGAGNAGDIYSFGLAASTDRALGELRSGTLVPILGATFTNNTGESIVSLDIAYTGEQWRLGTAGRADHMDFQIGTTATSLTSSGYVDVDSLDFTSPVSTGTAGALNGNLAANRAVVSGTISGLAIPNGATFWIRWTDADVTGADDGIGIDDFSLTPHTGTPSLNPTGTGSANPGSASPGSSTLLAVNVTPGLNPVSTGLAVTGNLAAIGGSTTQPFFDDGSHGDAVAGDNIFSVTATVALGTGAGAKNLPITITDAESRVGSTSIAFNVDLVVSQIHDIQGNGAVSPVHGQVTTEGIVTGVKFNGFFIQAPDSEADTDPNTSEAVFVFTNSSPGPPASAVVGNRVRVTGTVSEFKSTSTDPDGLSATEITGPTVTLVSAGSIANLPAAITLTSADLFQGASFLQLEKYEGMRVHLNSVVSIAPTDGTVNETSQQSTTSGLFYGVLPGTARPMREPGIQTPLPVPAEAPAGAHPPMFDGDYERIGVDSFSAFLTPAAAAVFPPPPGSTLEVTTGIPINNITGPLDYAFASYIVDAEDWDRPVAAAPNFTFAPVSDRAAGEFTVASANMERFFDTVDDAGTSDAVLTPAAYQGRLQKMSRQVRDVMKMPDVIGVEEMEHLSTLQDLADRVNADALATGDHPDYHAFLVEGNDIGGIDSGLLVRADRVDLAPGHFTVTQYGKDTTYADPGGGAAVLNDRPPLVLEASVFNPPFEPYRITVIVNHLRSLSGADGNDSDGLRIRTKRRIQGEYLAQLIKSFQDQGKRVISVGDYNAFEINDGYVDVVGIAKGAPAPGNEVTQNTTLTAAQMPSPALTDLVQTAPADQRYSFLFDGIAQELDHILVTPDLMVNRLNWGRTNADFPESYRGDFTRPERVSDHDPIVAYFAMGSIDTTPPTITVPADITIEGDTLGGATVTFTATAHDGVDGDITPSCAPASGSVFAVGTTEVVCTATDAHGNSSSGTFHVTVTDTTPPVLSLPPNVTLEATGPAGAPFTFSASAFDIVSGNVPVTCTAASGTVFPIGSTGVTCDAVDGSGNHATGAFTVTVVDTTAPTITVPGPITREATGPGGAAVTFAVSASDSVDGSLTPTCSAASGSVFPIGTTHVTCSVTDAHGNTGHASFDVTVVDSTAPDTTINSKPSNPSGASATFTFSGTDTGSGVAGFQCALDAAAFTACTSPITYGSLAIGSHTFKVRAFDAAGNVDPTPAAYTWVVALSPRDLKNRALQSLLPYAAGNRKIAKAVAFITDSLTASYWVDATHLTAAKGDQVFINERHAVRELKTALRRADDDDPCDDGYRPERDDRMLSAAAQAAAAQAIDDLVEADRLLVVRAIADAQAAHVVNPRNAGQVALAIVAAQFNAAVAALEARFNLEALAIVQYRLAWDNAQSALKKAAQH